jgi:hypothetical protein
VPKVASPPSEGRRQAVWFGCIQGGLRGCVVLSSCCSQGPRSRHLCDGSVGWLYVEEGLPVSCRARFEWMLRGGCCHYHGGGQQGPRWRQCRTRMRSV